MHHHKPPLTHLRSRIWAQARIVLALVFAVVLHAGFLLVPLHQHSLKTEAAPAQIQIQLTTISSPLEQDIFSHEPEPEPTTKPEPITIVKAIAEVIEPKPRPSPIVEQPAVPFVSAAPLMTLIPARRNPEQLTTEEKNRLTHSILSRQFITQEPMADKLFGNSVELRDPDTQRAFHYPQQANMLSRLNQGMQDLPFKYTPGLINFAYASGVKGNMQRFWDVITPEFGWITDNGTEFKCVWILIVGGCGWK